MGYIRRDCDCYGVLERLLRGFIPVRTLARASIRAAAVCRCMSGPLPEPLAECALGCWVGLVFPLVGSFTE